MSLAEQARRRAKWLRQRSGIQGPASTPHLLEKLADHSVNTTWTFDGCHECFFKGLDSGVYSSDFVFCHLPGEQNPGPLEVAEAIQQKTSPPQLQT